MKKEQIFLMVGAAAAVFLILKTVKAKAATPAVSTAGQQYTSIVANDNGWKYYSDGTAIAPNGDYYFQGQKVYSPPASGATVYQESGMFGLTADAANSGWMVY